MLRIARHACQLNLRASRSEPQHLKLGKGVIHENDPARAFSGLVVEAGQAHQEPCQVVVGPIRNLYIKANGQWVKLAKV